MTKPHPDSVGCVEFNTKSPGGKKTMPPYVSALIALWMAERASVVPSPTAPYDMTLWTYAPLSYTLASALVPRLTTVEAVAASVAVVQVGSDAPAEVRSWPEVPALDITALA